MTNLRKIVSNLIEGGPLIKQTTLKDTDLVNLTVYSFKVAINGHLYDIEEKLSDIVNNSKPFSLKYSGEIRMNRRNLKEFQTFEKFKENYNLIKERLEKE